eukprot:353857-Chlamydomonas_euryale.AAC.8
MERPQSGSTLATQRACSACLRCRAAILLREHTPRRSLRLGGGRVMKTRRRRQPGLPRRCTRKKPCSRHTSNSTPVLGQAPEGARFRPHPPRPAGYPPRLRPRRPFLGPAARTRKERPSRPARLAANA